MRRDIAADEITQELLSDPAFLDVEYVFVIPDGSAIPGFDTKRSREKMSRMSSVQQIMQDYSGNPVTLRCLTTKFEVSTVIITAGGDTIFKFVLFYEYKDTLT